MTLPALMVVLVVMLSVFIGGAAVALQRCRTDHLDFHIIVGQQFDGAVFICYINIRKAEILSARAQNVLIGLDGQHGFGIGCAHRSAVDFLSVRIIANTHEFTRLINAGNLGKVVFHLCLARALAVHKNFHTVGIRVGIVKCAYTGKYVCWIKHCGDDACFTVLQADKFLGPYEIVKAHYRPFGCEVGDFDIAVCGDTAYLYMDANHNGQLTMRLTRDFLEAEEKICWQYEGLHAPFSREAPAVFEHGGKWYMLTSGMTGYVPNKSDSAVSDAPDRPFVSIGDPHADDASHASFNSQISQVFKVPGKRDLYIALADRWVPDYPVDAKLADLLERCTAQRFDPEHYKASSEEMQTMMQGPMLTSANTSRANYVWLPITFEEGKPKIYWRDSWKLSDFE